MLPGPGTCEAHQQARTPTCTRVYIHPVSFQMSEYYTGCEVIWTTGTRTLLLCNQTTPTSSPSTTSETIQDSTANILATTAAPTTVDSTTYSPTTPAPAQRYTPTPSQYLRGYTTTPSSSYTSKSNVSTGRNKTDPLSSITKYPEYIYRINETETYPPTKMPPLEPNLIGVWVFLGMVVIGFVCMVGYRHMKNKRKEMKRRKSVNPKNRNSWVQSAKAQDVLLQMSTTKPEVLNLKQLKPPRPKRPPPTPAMARITIQEITQGNGMEKLKRIRREKLRQLRINKNSNVDNES